MGSRFFFDATGMRSGITTACCLAAFFAAAGCDTNSLGTVDTAGTPPVIHRSYLSRTAANVDTLTPQNGVYTIVPSPTLFAVVTDPDGPSGISRVSTGIFRPGAGEPFVTIGLHNDGVPPDAVAGDSVFSASVQFTLTRSQTGAYIFSTEAVDLEGNRSSADQVSFFAGRNNAAPQLMSGSLVAPDTVVRATTGDVLVFLSVAATDSDGIADIRDVYLRNLTGSDPNARTFMFDDGGVLRNQVTSGDRLAGDGVFSVIVRLPSTTTPGLRVFAFQASDSFADTSASLLHSILVQ